MTAPADNLATRQSWFTLLCVGFAAGSIIIGLALLSLPLTWVAGFLILLEALFLGLLAFSARKLSLLRR